MRRILLILLVFVIAPQTIAGQSFALSDEQRRVIGSGAHYFDVQNVQCEPNSSGINISLPDGASLEDKVSQLMFIGIRDASNKNVAIELARDQKIGGIMLLGNGWDAASINEVKSAATIPLIIASDEEGGSVQRLKSETGDFPSAQELNQSTPEEIKNIATEYGSKLNELGVDVNYAPVVDVVDPNGYIAGDSRGFSDNPDEVATSARAFAEGMQEAGITPVFKHFPGHGGVPGNTHLEPVTTADLQTLRSKDLLPYEQVLSDDVGVMMSHLTVPGLTNDRASSVSPEAYALLREEFNFGGIVFTDDMNMGAVNGRSAQGYVNPVSIVEALAAGADMALYSYGSEAIPGEIINHVVEAIENNNGLSEDRIDDALIRVKRLKSSINTTNVTADDNCPASCSFNGELPIPAYWQNLILSAAPFHPTTDPRTVAAVLYTENRSWPDPDRDWATSSAGARGPWQFIASSWTIYTNNDHPDFYFPPEITSPDINNPEHAVHAAFNHLANTKGLPLVEEETGNPETDYSLPLTNGTMLEKMARYNGAGALYGTPVNQQPNKENGDYVRMTFWLVASNFSRTFNTNSRQIVDIDNSGGGASLSGGCINGVIGEGGLNEEQAKQLMINYGANRNGDSAANTINWTRCNGGGSNCVTFSQFFLNKFTDSKVPGPMGHGRDVVRNRGAEGVPTGNIPQVYSVFSWSNSGFGHTGVVLGVQGDTIIVGHASCSNRGIGAGDGTQEGGGSGFIRVGKYDDPYVWLGRVPDEFAYPENVDTSIIGNYIDETIQ